MKMKKTTFLFVVASLLLHITIYAQGTHEAMPLGSTAAPYGFYEYLPKDYSTSGQGSPLLIFLHGSGEKGDGKSQLDDAVKFGPGREIEGGRHFSFVILSPQTSDHWNPDKLNDLIQHAEENYNIDKNRIYLTGLSMGAMGLIDYLEKYSEKIAAVVPIAGSGEPDKSCGYSNVPLWAFHGDKDDVVPISGSQAIVNAYNNCSPTPDPKARLTVLEGKRHWGWNEVYDGSLGHDIYSWFLNYSKDGSDTPAPNNPPTANAGQDKALTLPSNSLTLEGSATDSDGEINQYQWEKVSGPTVDMDGIKTKALKLKNLKEGDYSFRLTATDNKGATGSDEVKVKVHPEEKKNKAPVADAGSDKSVQLPQAELLLSGNASDEDGNITKFKWEKTSGPSVALSGENTANVKLKELQEGTYIFRFTVTDNDGAGDSDELKLEVKAADDDDKEERKIIADAGSDSNLQLPADEYLIAGKASLHNCRIKSYQWEKVSGPTVTMKGTATANLVLSDLKEGEYTFRFTASSTSGESDSDDMKLLVKAEAGSAGGGDLPAGAVQGLSYAYYEINPSKPWSRLPDFSAFTPEKTGIEPSFSLSPREQDNYFAFVFTGYIKIEEAGTYFFYSLSDDGSKIYLNNELVVDNDGIHPEEVEYNSVELEEGYQKIRIEFFENYGEERLYVSYKGPGVELQELPRAKLHTLPAESQNGRMASASSSSALDFGEEAAPAAELNLYPNPVKRMLNLQLGAMAQEQVMITIMDLSGRTLYRKARRAGAGSTSLQLDLDAMRLGEGSYVLLIEDVEQQQVQSFRFVKN